MCVDVPDAESEQLLVLDQVQDLGVCRGLRLREVSEEPEDLAATESWPSASSPITHGWSVPGRPAEARRASDRRREGDRPRSTCPRGSRRRGLPARDRLRVTFATSELRQAPSAFPFNQCPQGLANQRTLLAGSRQPLCFQHKIII